MQKQYGLIIPGKQKPVIPPKADFKKPSIFDESSDSEDNNGPPQLKMKSAPIGPGASEKRIAKKIHEKALEEDPTVFQYDELYDDIESKRDEVKKAKSSEVKKPKYIGRLLECAEKRKLENERRIERMVQKEREQEGEQFKDKESFVTSAYRKKLEDMQKAEEQEKREDYLEAIGDVTKQKDLDGFYRHLYEQKLGPKEGNKEIANKEASTSSKEPDVISYKPIKSGKSRAYRKRHSSEEEDPESEKTIQPNKKIHLQSNLDADSDFSIDSSSDEDDEEKNQTNLTASQPVDNTCQNLSIKEEPTDDENKKISIASVDSIAEDIKKEKDEKEEIKVITPKPKKDKTLVWKKRTVGDVFNAALQRYYQRKASRNG